MIVKYLKKKKNWISRTAFSAGCCRGVPLASLSFYSGAAMVLSFKNDRGHCVIGEFFNAAEMFWYPSSDLCLNTILSWSSTDNSFNLMAWFLLWHALSTVGPYIDRCVPFQIMSNQLNLPQVDPNQVVEISQGWSMETECTWAHLSSIIYLCK